MTHQFVFPEHYQQQLDNKIQPFREQLASLNIDEALPTISVFESPRTHYRLRAEFKIWQQDSQAHYAMHKPGIKQPFIITDFPVASVSINRLMPTLLAAINAQPILRQRLFQIEFLNTLTDEMLVTLIYHKPLDESWINAATLLKNSLGITLIGRSRKQKVLLDKHYVNETLHVNNTPFHYQQVEGSFTQPNGHVCEKMLSWALSQTRTLTGDLLELYCGNGNFTIPLAQHFTKVLATEISKTSVASAQVNIEKNNATNIEIARMSSEEFAQALDKVRQFRRLGHIELDHYQFSTIFVDPPRAGLDEHTLDITQRFDNIIYISCNPATLIDNLHRLCQTHEITALAAFDQFPYTDHLETGVILRKRTA